MAISIRSAIRRNSLERLVDERLEDFDVLLREKRSAAAIYLGVYAVECRLKVNICNTLDLDELPETYKSHNLMGLLHHSGLYRRIQADQPVYESLKKLAGLWNPADEDRNVRYIDDPSKYGETAANDVRDWMLDSTNGVIPWLRSHT